MIRDTIFENPLPLLTIKDSKIIKTINNYLPFSTGFEIECDKSSNWQEENFKSIPDIMEVICDNGEQRFRVPSGLKGLVCIWNICEQLKLQSELTKSGTHIHVDFTDTYDYLNLDIVTLNEQWILEELDTWKYPGNYNIRGFSGFTNTGAWVRFQPSFRTLEFRICEMTFDYPLLIKRIIHCNDIVRRLKIAVFEGPNVANLHNLQNKLQLLKKQEYELSSDTLYSDVVTEVVKSRVRKI